MAKPGHLALLHRPEPLHRLPGLRPGLHRVRHPSRRIDDSPRVRRSGAEHADRAGRLHALRAADMRRGLPGRCHQAHRRRRRPVGVEAALHCVRQLRDRVPVWRAGGLRTPADHDEVRHVLRPHRASARSRCARRSARARRCSSGRAPRSSRCARSRRPINTFRFGGQTITTRVFMMAPRRVVAPATARGRDGGAGQATTRRARPRMMPLPAAAGRRRYPFAEVEVCG